MFCIHDATYPVTYVRGMASPFKAGHLNYTFNNKKKKKKGGHLHRLFPNVNSETAKYTSPRKLGSVYLAVSSLTLG